MEIKNALSRPLKGLCKIIFSVKFCDGNIA